MEKLDFRVIETRLDQELFLDKVENYSGVRLSDTYISQSKMIGVYLDGKLAAGYMLVTQGPFRSLLFVPDEHQKRSKLSSIDSYEMMEINGLWIGPALKTPILQMKVWLRLVKDIFASKKNYILLMRDLRNKTMERFLGMANPKPVYTGIPMLMAGEKTHESIEVSFTTRWKLVLNSYKYALELLRRQKKATAFNRSRDAIKKIESNNPEMA